MTTKTIMNKSPMELDLNLFLQTSTSDEEDDEDANRLHHRTVDDILNDSDSSSSSSSPPHSSSSFIHRTESNKGYDSATNDDAVSVFSNSNYSSRPTTTGDVNSKPNLFTSGGRYSDFSGDSFSFGRKPVVARQQLPALFGSVRSNAKPGAALAAAAAASRSIPTPHAAAIKSRRASIANLHKELSASSGDQSKIVVSGALLAASSNVSELDRRLGDQDDEFNDFQSAHLDKNEKSSNGEVEDATMLANDALEVNESSVEKSEENTLGLKSKENTLVLLSNGTNDDDLTPISAEVNSATSSATELSESAVPSSSGLAKDLKSEEKLQVGTLEVENQETGLANQSDDDISVKDVNELVEDMIAELESRMENKKMDKKSHPPSMKPLELAEQLEMKYASTGLHWEEGAAAQPMRLEGVRRGSIALGYFDIDSNNTVTRTISSQAFRRDHGSPQVLAVNLNYIAVGMSKGVIMVVPSKYTAQSADNMDSKTLMLGIQGDRSQAAVTSMCFNQQGDLLLAGYGDGHITVWDLQRATAAKVITGEHSAPVVHTFFLGQDSQVTRNFKAVTGDSKGLVLLHTFSVVPLLNRFSNKTQCLLDGQRTGTVLAAAPLLFDEVPGGYSMPSTGNATVSTSSIGSMMGGVVGGDAGWKLFTEGSTLVEEGVVVFVTHQTALVVRLSPNLEVYAQFSKPDGVREGSMPCTAWKYMVQSQNMPAEAPERVSLLAIAWDRKVQVAKLVKSELKVYGKWTLDSPAIGVAWLDDQMLVVLTLTGQLCLFAKDGTVIHQTSFAVDGTGGDDLVAYHTHFTNIFGNPEKAYNNCLSVRGATIYILGSSHLIVSRLLPWKERIQVLRKAGDWMGSLNMAMTLYDGHSHGVIDLPRSLDAVQAAIMPYLVELLLSYVDEVFSYMSVAFCNQIGKGEPPDDQNDKSTSVRSEIKEQFTRVGGVAVEFCVHIKRTDILFDEIFSKFVSVQHRDTFLELLEPYVLRDMLGFLPPEIMQGLVEHYSSKGWLQRVEQCVLHMDISSLDFNQVVRLCREHGLYGALVYLFNRGLDDYRAPLEELMVVLQNSPRESAAVIGYRMLVYLKYCFSGLAFPPGHGEISAVRLPSLRVELMMYLLEDSSSLKSKAVKNLSTSRTHANLYHLLELDTEATLDVLRCAFVENDMLKPHSLEHELDDSDMDAKKKVDSSAESQKLLVQQTVDALVNILDIDISAIEESTGNDDLSKGEVWPSMRDIGHLFEFIAYYVACERACVSKSVLSRILEYLTSDNSLPSSNFSNITASSNGREKQVLSLLEVVPRTDWDSSYVLKLCEKINFHQVCGLIYTIRCQHLNALDSYIKDAGEPIHAFSFINNTLGKLIDTELANFRAAVVSRTPDLVNLSREGTFLLLTEDFNKESQHIISELRSHPYSLFLYLKTVIEVHLSGTLNFSNLIKDESVNVHRGGRLKDQSCGIETYLQRIAAFPKLIRNNPVVLTDDMVEVYFELLCKYERNLVLKFLETFESYRVEHCLRLCQEYGIIDAAAFLLERVGDVGSALLLTLSGINDQFIKLDTAVENILANDKHTLLDTVLRMKEVNDIRDMLHACIGLCQRNTPRLDPEEAESLWFRLLDSFCEPLMEADKDKRVDKEKHHVGTLDEASSKLEEGSLKHMWRISKSREGFQTLRRLFSQFIKEIVEGMIGHIRLPAIMSKLLSDNGGQEFGDFKLTILGMLGTYGFERRILGTAKSLIEDDTFYTMSLLKKGASHGYAPRSLSCCICNCPLTKNASSSSVRVFNCGHATHLHCEFVETETSKRGSSSGCPICMPKKKIQKSRTKSSLIEHGLVSKYLSKHPQGTGITASHPYESDPFESPYGQQQISRFDILTNLQKDQGLIQVENIPQLRLAPPAVYHEKVKKRTDFLTGESSSSLVKVEKSSKNRKLKDLKVKGSSLRFPLKSSIFGKEKTSRQ